MKRDRGRGDRKERGERNGFRVLCSRSPSVREIDRTCDNSPDYLTGHTIDAISRFFLLVARGRAPIATHTRSSGLKKIGFKKKYNIYIYIWRVTIFIIKVYKYEFTDVIKQKNRWIEWLKVDILYIYIHTQKTSQFWISLHTDAEWEQINK